MFSKIKQTMLRSPARNSGHWLRVVWCFEDGQEGHRRQLEGLVEALQTQQDLSVFWLHYYQSSRDLPDPDLILVCGRRTHWPGLRAHWRRGGWAVALMNPGLLRPLFDVCIMPEHDGLPMSRKQIVTRGPLNPLVPSSRGTREAGLLLIGGPSRHYRWDTEDLLRQIERLRCALPSVSWVVATSRRTPESCVDALRSKSDTTFSVHTAIDTQPHWLPGKYAQCGITWVTPDSASMVYEALSSGAAVGVLGLTPRKPNRLQAGIDQLLASGCLVNLATLEQRGEMPAAVPPLREAQRAAAALRARFIAQADKPHCSPIGK
jgi:uncharacterized protein